MGHEYRLHLELSGHAQADKLLRGVAGFERFSEEFGLYSFRRDSTGVMPDVDAKLEPSGIYLCYQGRSFAIVSEIPVLIGEWAGDREKRSSGAAGSADRGGGRDRPHQFAEEELFGLGLTDFFVTLITTTLLELQEPRPLRRR